MNMHCEREMRQRVLEEMIAEVEKSIQQFRRTLDGLQQRIAAEERQRELLEQKRNAIVHMVGADEESVSIADVIAKILLERGEPMRVQEIVRALVENGITSSGGDAPVNSVLSAVSRRSDLFERVSRGTYTLKEDCIRPSGRAIAHRTLAVASS